VTTSNVDKFGSRARPSLDLVYGSAHAEFLKTKFYGRCRKLLPFRWNEANRL